MIPASFAGNLTSDPEGREVGKSHVARFTVAVDDGYRDREGEWQSNPPLFVNVEVWGSVARGVVAQMSKGSAAVVHGRWRAAEYEKDGEKRRRQYVVADSVGAVAFVAPNPEPRTQSAAEPDETSAQEDEEPAADADGEPGGGDFWDGAK